jgi:ABC-2 type transport system ATP-binding protein
MEEAERCDRVAILSEGRLVADGTPRELKSELGEETLWLDTDVPDALCDDLKTQFGVDARVIGPSVQIDHPDAPALLASIYDAVGDRIHSATLRRPTLEDVFMVHAGVRPDVDDETVFDRVSGDPDAS